jgi:hypothetical protein
VPQIRIHAVIISWEGKSDAARRIAAQVCDQVDVLSVVYSNAHDMDECGAGDWHRLPNSAFFGPKFQRAADVFAADVLLLIHADTETADWAHLVTRCRAAFDAQPTLGLWSPDFTHTPWRTPYVAMLPVPGSPDLVSVAQTDGIILAMTATVVARLRLLDLTANNLGWGIDWAAVAFCMTTGRLVSRDTSVIVTHAKTRGYGDTVAKGQMRAFFAQLSGPERNQIVLLHTYCMQQRHASKSRLFRLLRPFVRSWRERPFWVLQ